MTLYYKEKLLMDQIDKKFKKLYPLYHECDAVMVLISENNRSSIFFGDNIKGLKTIKEILLYDVINIYEEIKHHTPSTLINIYSLKEGALFEAALPWLLIEIKGDNLIASFEIYGLKTVSPEIAAGCSCFSGEIIEVKEYRRIVEISPEFSMEVYKEVPYENKTHYKLHEFPWDKFDGFIGNSYKDVPLGVLVELKETGTSQLYLIKPKNLIR